MKKFLLVLLLMPCFSALAQIKFEPGYFIDNNGIKTECLIRNIGWKNNPVSFGYKLSDSDPEKQGQIANVSAFEVGNYIFRRYTVDIDRSSKDISLMSEKEEPNFKSENLYLSELVTGEATLYKYEDGNLVRYFASKGNSNPEQLIYKPYRTGDRIATNSTYKGQLYRLFKDKISDYSLIKNTDYSESQLIKLFVKYNGNENTVHHINEAKGKINIRIVAGAALITTHNKNIDLEYTHTMDPKTAIVAGIEAEWVLPFNQNKWSVFARPLYQSYSQTGTQTYNEGISTLNTKWEINYRSIDVPLGIRYYFFLNDNSKLSLSAAYLYSFKMSGSKAKFNVNGSIYNSEYGSPLSNSAGFMAAAGYNYKNAGIEFCYYLPRQIMNNYAYWGSRYSGPAVLISYKLL